MQPVPEIGVAAAREKLDEGSATFVDMRDPGSHESARIPGASPLTDDTVAGFLATADRSRPVIVYCYHGHSSLAGAAFLLERGFAEVHSMSGGFEAWRHDQPCERGPAGRGGSKP